MKTRVNLINNLGSNHFASLQNQYHEGLQEEKQKLEKLRQLRTQLILAQCQTEKVVDLEAIEAFKKEVMQGKYKMAKLKHDGPNCVDN